jgi:hypothetical protein
MVLHQCLCGLKDCSFTVVTSELAAYGTACVWLDIFNAFTATGCYWDTMVPLHTMLQFLLSTCVVFRPGVTPSSVNTEHCFGESSEGLRAIC